MHFILQQKQRDCDLNRCIFSLKNIGEFSSLHGRLIILTGALRSEINESSFTFASVRSWGIECFTREESEETLPFT